MGENTRPLEWIIPDTDTKNPPTLPNQCDIAPDGDITDLKRRIEEASNKSGAQVLREMHSIANSVNKQWD